MPIPSSRSVFRFDGDADILEETGWQYAAGRYNDRIVGKYAGPASVLDEHGVWPNFSDI